MNLLFASWLILKVANSHDHGEECTSTETETITGVIYADNWFSFWFNGQLVAEDPVDFIPHQAVHVSFEAPVCGERVFAIQAEDFSDDITALEYDDNCIGDGGLKAMFSDGTVSNSDWECKTIFYGPIDPADCIPNYDSAYHFVPALCKFNANETLKGRDCHSEYYAHNSTGVDWFDMDFEPEDDEGWEPATEFSDDVVGFGVVPSNCSEFLCPGLLDWSMYGPQASFIWRPDLNFDNRILCRYSYVVDSDFEYTTTMDEEAGDGVDKLNTYYLVHVMFIILCFFSF